VGGLRAASRGASRSSPAAGPSNVGVGGGRGSSLVHTCRPVAARWGEGLLWERSRDHHEGAIICTQTQAPTVAHPDNDVGTGNNAQEPQVTETLKGKDG